MAYRGYIQWNSGDTLDAEDAMTYLMQQTPTIWDTAYNRDNNANYFASLIEGNLSFIQATDTLYYYDGAAWKAIATKAYVDSTSATARDALILSYMNSN